MVSVGSELKAQTVGTDNPIVLAVPNKVGWLDILSMPGKPGWTDWLAGQLHV